jgi:hypothetical protein
VRRRWLALGLVAVLVFAIGMAIGRQGDSPEAASPPTATVTVTETGAALRPARKADKARSGFARTPEGAVSAAATYIGSLDGRVLVDPAKVRRRLTDIASSEAREGLIRAYTAAAEQTRTQLGIGTVPEPVVILRASPVGYRVDRFTPLAATVAIWRVGIVGSGATAEPQQSWRTETVSLVWEKRTWKVAALRSEPGPTPPLPTSAAMSTASELFTSVPQFEEFELELP